MMWILAIYEKTLANPKRMAYAKHAFEYYLLFERNRRCQFFNVKFERTATV
jgi:hypothetical protein